MSLDLQGAPPLGGGQVTGWLRYYAPTKGRCDAYRSAFKAMKDLMKEQGVNTRTNPLYDFRCSFNDDSGALANQATLDGANGLILHSLATPRASVFGIHNENVAPTYTGTAGDLFSPGFDTILQSGVAATDFVLNDAVPYLGNTNEASVNWEYIPFTMSWTPGTTDQAISFQWRPDPALYLAIMNGLLQVYVEELDLDAGTPSVNINIAVMVSGWKSIMSERRHRKKDSKKAMSTKTSSKK